MGLFEKFKKKKDHVEASKPETKVEVAKEKKSVSAETAPKKTTEEKALKSDIKNTQKKSKKPQFSKAHSVLVKSFVSEKAARAESGGVYTFAVDPKANKFDIKQAIKEVYGMAPKKVRVINFEGKRVRFGRTHGKRSDWKKAVVTMPKGKTINIHEGV